MGFSICKYIYLYKVIGIIQVRLISDRSDNIKQLFQHKGGLVVRIKHQFTIGETPHHEEIDKIPEILTTRSQHY